MRPQIHSSTRLSFIGVPNVQRHLIPCHPKNGVHVIFKRPLSSQHQRPDGINRLSNFWIPTGGIESSRDSQDESHALLVRAGYLRQAHSGIFHMLPLGHRVLQKLERLIDKHMMNIGASKLSLSSISSEELWRRTGRYVGHGGELFAFEDRKEAKFLLAPTHEEEITSLVAATAQSYKDLPLRLYQITRKYRDEARPRQGLLRGREFIMKDLYTFDHTEEDAHQTYDQVQAAYRAFLDELKLPYLVAKADSGNMGGSLSHEYHFVSHKGEDNVISCQACGHTINDELDLMPVRDSAKTDIPVQVQSWYGISKDRKSLVIAWFPHTAFQDKGIAVENQVNFNAIRAVVPDIDLSVDNPIQAWDKANPKGHDGLRAGASVVEITDGRLPSSEEVRRKQQDLLPSQTLRDSEQHETYNCTHSQVKAEINGELVQLTRTLSGSACPNCDDSKVTVDRAIEIGHTFYLGTRYSKPLDAMIVNKDDQRVPIQMGCHGIGVSRLVGAIASILCDDKGLNWPSTIAPFHVVLIPGKGHERDAEALSQTLQVGQLGSAVEIQDVGRGLDAVVDDRNKPIGWKLNDADLVGYPLIVVLGRAWKERKVEIQCRRLGIKEEVDEADIAARVLKYLGQL